MVGATESPQPPAYYDLYKAIHCIFCGTKTSSEVAVEPMFLRPWRDRS